MITRRSFLSKVPLGVSLAGGLVLVAQPSQAALMPASAAGYQDKPNGDQHCSGCAKYVAPNGCKIVDGAINPNGWCRFFSAKS